jgi:hypothetical protein
VSAVEFEISSCSQIWDGFVVLPPIYKYLDVQGAKLTLSNGTFKHAKPSDFNDIEDLTIQSIFPEEIETALKKLSDGFTAVILQHLNDQPTCIAPMREKLALIQQVYRANPKAAQLVKAGLDNGGGTSVYDIRHVRKLEKQFIGEINEFMQGYRILCVTTHKDSERMWSEYAETHMGITLRIEPNVAKDSEFQLFRPVNYHKERPPLYDDTLDYIADSLFGDQEARRKEIIEKIVYSKTLFYQHEGEYRLAIPIRNGEPPWNTQKYHPEEITELYLGCAIQQVDKEEIVSKAKRLNPDIAIYQGVRGADRKLTFQRI